MAVRLLSRIIHCEGSHDLQFGGIELIRGVDLVVQDLGEYHAWEWS
jgi:hypothetical protein